MSHEERFFFFSPPFFPLLFSFLLFFFISRNARAGYKSGEVGEKCRFVNYRESRYLGIRTKYSSFARNPSEKSATHSVMIESSKVEWKFFPPSLYFFSEKNMTKFVKQAMNRSIAINAERYFENMFPFTNS